MNTVIRLLLALALAGGLGPVAASADPGPASYDEEPEPTAPPNDEAYWRARAAEARERLAEAEAALEAANADVTRMRNSNYPRGDERAALYAARDAARAERDAARRLLEEGLPAEAEKVGANPAWVSR